MGPDDFIFGDHEDEEDSNSVKGIIKKLEIEAKPKPARGRKDAKKGMVQSVLKPRIEEKPTRKKTGVIAKKTGGAVMNDKKQGLKTIEEQVEEEKDEEKVIETAKGRNTQPINEEEEINVTLEFEKLLQQNDMNDSTKSPENPKELRDLREEAGARELKIGNVKSDRKKVQELGNETPEEPSRHSTPIKPADNDGNRRDESDNPVMRAEESYKNQTPKLGEVSNQEHEQENERRGGELTAGGGQPPEEGEKPPELAEEEEQDVGQDDVGEEKGEERGKNAAWVLWGEKKIREDEEANRERKGRNLKCYKCGREGHSLRMCTYTRHTLGYPLHSGDGMCYHCGGGHIVIKCRHLKGRCYGCGSVQHTAENCEEDIDWNEQSKFNTELFQRRENTQTNLRMTGVGEKAPPEVIGRETPPLGYQVTKEPHINEHQNHEKVMEVNSKEGGGLELVPRELGQEVQHRNSERKIVTYSQILTRTNDTVMNQITMNQDQGGQNDQAQHDKQVQLRKAGVKYNKNPQGGPQVQEQLILVDIKEARRRIEATQQDGCRIGITLNNKSASLKNGKEKEIGEDICKLLEMKYNQLVHVSDLDKKTGKIIMTYNTMPNLELLRRLSEGGFQGEWLAKSKTTLHAGHVLKYKETLDEAQEAKLMRVRNVDLNPRMGEEMMEVALKMEEMMKRTLFKRENENRGSEIELKVVAWGRTVDGRPQDPTLTGTLHLEFLEKGDIEDMVETMGGRGNIPANIFIKGKKHSIHLGLGGKPCQNCNLLECTNGGERACVKVPGATVGQEEQKKRSDDFLQRMNVTEAWGRKRLWTPRERQGEEPAPLKMIEIEGVELLSHSKGETDEELGAQARFSCVNVRRTNINSVEGGKKLREAKTQDKRVETMREYGEKSEEVDCTTHLQIKCERSSNAHKDTAEGSILEVKVTIAGKEGSEVYEVDKELQLMKLILRRLQSEHPGWRQSKVREERLINSEVSATFMGECMDASMKVGDETGHNVVEMTKTDGSKERVEIEPATSYSTLIEILKEKGGANLLITNKAEEEGESVMCHQCGHQMKEGDEQEAHENECDNKIWELIRQEEENGAAKKKEQEEASNVSRTDGKEQGKGIQEEPRDDAKEDVTEGAQEHLSQDGGIAGTPELNALENDDVDLMEAHAGEVDIKANPTRRLGSKVLAVTKKKMGYQQSITARGYADLGEEKTGVTNDTVHGVVQGYADINQGNLKGVEIWSEEWSGALVQEAKRPTYIQPIGSEKKLMCYERQTWKKFWDQDTEVNPFRDLKAEQVIIVTTGWHIFHMHMRFSVKNNLFVINIVDSTRDENFKATDIQKRISSTMNKLGWKGRMVAGHKLPRSSTNPKRQALPGEVCTVMRVPRQVKESNDCGAYQIVMLKKMIDNPTRYREATNKNTTEGWREFLGIENPTTTVGVEIWKGQIREEAAVIARDTILKMRYKVLGPTFNTSIPRQMQEVDRKTGHRVSSSLITAKETVLRLAMDDNASKDARKVWQEEDEEAGDHLRSSWRNGKEVEKYREENPNAGYEDIVSYAQREHGDSRKRSDVTMTDDENQSMTKEDEDGTKAGQEEDKRKAEAAGETEVKTTADTGTEPEKEQKIIGGDEVDKQQTLQAQMDKEAQEAVDIENMMEVNASMTLIEDISEDEAKVEPSVVENEGDQSSDLEILEENKGNDREDEDELPKIDDGAGGSSEPEIIGEASGIEVVMKDMDYNKYKCERCKKAFSKEKELARHYQVEHSKVDGKTVLVEVTRERNFRAKRVRMMDEERAKARREGREKAEAKERGHDITEKCEVKLKNVGTRVKLAMVQRGGQKKSPEKNKKRRATESSTDEEKTPKNRKKKLKGEDAQKPETPPKPRQAGAANPDNRSRGRMPETEAEEHAERAVGTIRAMGNWMKTARDEVWTGEGEDAKWNLANLVVEEGHEPGVQTTTSAIGGTHSLQVMRVAALELPDKFGSKEKGANWTTKVKEMVKNNKLPDDADVTMMQGMVVTQAAVRLITKAFENGVNKKDFKETKCMLILGHEGIASALGKDEKKVQMIKMELGASSRASIRPEVLEGDGELLVAIQDGKGVYVTGTVMVTCPGKKLCLGRCKAKEEMMSIMVVSYQEDKGLGGAMMTMALTTLSAMPEPQMEKLHNQSELWVKLEAKAQVGHEGEAQEKSLRLVNKIKDGIETLKPDNPALKTMEKLYERAASMELREHVTQATYEREKLKQRIVLYNRERKESPVLKEKMSLEEVETVLKGLEGSVELEEERTIRGRGKVLVSYQPLNEYRMVRDALTGEVDTLLMDREDWEELTRGGIIGEVEKIDPRGKEQNRRVGATDWEKISFFGESSYPTEEDERKSRGEVIDDRRSTLTGGEKDGIFQDLMKQEGINKPGWNRDGLEETFGEGVTGGYCRNCTSCKRSVCKEEDITPRCIICQQKEEGKKPIGCQTGCQNRPPCPEKAPIAYETYKILGVTRLDSVSQLLGKEQLDENEKIDLLDAKSLKKKRADPSKARVVVQEKTAVSRLTEEELADEKESFRNFYGPRLEEMAIERWDEVAKFNETNERRMGIVRREFPIWTKGKTSKKPKRKATEGKKQAATNNAAKTGVGEKRQHQDGEDEHESEEEKKKQKVVEEQDENMDEDREEKTIRYIDSPDEEKEERRVRRVGSQENGEEESCKESPERTVRMVEPEKPTMEDISEDEPENPDRVVRIAASEESEGDQGTLKSEDEPENPDRVVRIAPSEESESDQGTLNDLLEDSPPRRVVEVETIQPDTTLQETVMEGLRVESKERMVKESNTGIDDEDEEITSGHRAAMETEIDEEDVDSDTPVEEEAVYAEQLPDEEPHYDEKAIVEDIEQTHMREQDKKGKRIRREKEVAKYVTVGLAEAIRKLPLGKQSKQVAEEEDGQYSKEEMKEREAQAEKVREQVRREEGWTKGNQTQAKDGQRSSSRTGDGHKKEEGDSPNLADNL